MRVISLVVLFLLLTGCGGNEVTIGSEPPAASTTCADVENVVITLELGGTYRFDVTVRSSDTGWEKYADAWEVRVPDGSVLGTRILAHPHVDEQPFTRSLNGVEIPDGVGQVEVAARDLVEGFCGQTMQAEVPLS